MQNFSHIMINFVSIRNRRNATLRGKKNLIIFRFFERVLYFQNSLKTYCDNLNIEFYKILQSMG